MQFLWLYEYLLKGFERLYKALQGEAFMKQQSHEG